MGKTFEEKIKNLKAGVDGLLDKISYKSEPYFNGQAVGLNYVKELIDITFPELKESEDERLMKAAVWYLEHATERCAANYYGINPKEIIAWLEKKKEQVTDESEKIAAAYQLGRSDEKKQKEQKPLSTEETELNSIAFLEQLGYTCIPPKKEHKPVELDDETLTNLDRALCIVSNARGALPAYQTDDGIYECDKAIETLNQIMENGFQQPAEWSEEDSNKLNKVIEVLNYVSFNNRLVVGEIELEDLKNWLKSLRPQPKQEWSEEDEQYLLVCKNALNKYQHSDHWDANIISKWLEERLNPSVPSLIGSQAKSR